VLAFSGRLPVRVLPRSAWGPASEVALRQGVTIAASRPISAAVDGEPRPDRLAAALARGQYENRSDR
jgi:hypothetical protein